MFRIMVLDEDEVFRSNIGSLIQQCGHSSVSFSSWSEAKTFLQTSRVDLLISGLSLSSRAEPEFLQTVSAFDEANIPVVIITDNYSIETREWLFSLGFIDCIARRDLSMDRLQRYLDTLEIDDKLLSFMRSLRVAVIDDSSVILKISARILAMYGIRSIELFSDPLELLAIERGYDLYISDIVLKAMSGDDLVVNLRSRFPDSIIIAMSKFTGERPLSKVLLSGADDYIYKPFDAPALISRLKVNIRSYQYKKTLENRTVTDSLTELYNHRYSYERLEEEMLKAQRYSRVLSVLMLDVDDFKQINDNFGHRAGDEILISLAKIFKDALRQVDIVGRYGGEEFIIILPETDLAAAQTVAEKIRKSVEDCCSQQGVAITISVGLVKYKYGESTGDVIDRADALLYRAKRLGKNRVEVE